jgi:hypothetical protein
MINGIYSWTEENNSGFLLVVVSYFGALHLKIHYLISYPTNITAALPLSFPIILFHRICFNLSKSNPLVFHIFIFLQKLKIMLDIKKTYLTDENKRPVPVQVDIKTFEKMEQLLEDYALGKLIEENDPEENLSLIEAQEYYNQLF